MIKDKFYELENKLSSYGFIRINKSVIVNVHEIEYILPEVYNRYSIYMTNGVGLILSRSYVKGFKNYLKIR